MHHIVGPDFDAPASIAHNCRAADQENIHFQQIEEHMAVKEVFRH